MYEGNGSALTPEQDFRTRLSKLLLDSTDDAADSREQRPFLTALIRTQGTRPHTLREVFLCLAAQSCDDFEALVVGHYLSDDGLETVQSLIAEQPASLRARIRFVRVDEGNRTRPLNVGFEQARGRYVAILDDDDAIFANWVEVFRDLATSSPGLMLRAATIRQDVRSVEVQGEVGLRAEGPPRAIYPSVFEWVDHLHENKSPPVSLAFPRSAFTDLGIHFDERLTTTEDWDFIMSVASVVGVASSPEITSVYRWWQKRQNSSRTVHAKEEWSRNYNYARGKIESSPVLLSPSSILKIRELLDDNDAMVGELRRLRRLGIQAKIPSSFAQRSRDAEWLHRYLRVTSLFESKSWSVSRPLRAVGTLLSGRKEPTSDDCGSMDAEELDAFEDKIRSSASWKVTAPLRGLYRLKPYLTGSR